MAYKISTTHQFEKDLKRCIKRGYPMDEFRTVIQLLERDGCLPEVYRPHILHGDRKGQIPEQARLPVAFGNATSSPTGRHCCRLRLQLPVVHVSSRRIFSSQRIFSFIYSIQLLCAKLRRLSHTPVAQSSPNVSLFAEKATKSTVITKLFCNFAPVITL